MLLFRSHAWLVALALLVSQCASPAPKVRYHKEDYAKLLSQVERVGLDLGEFAFAGPAAVIDGDTVRVEGLGASLRLLAIDTEETFKHAKERAAFSTGWESYKKIMRGKSERPVKMATPMGDESKKWAQAWFHQVTRVRLERDHPGEIRDYYGRYLAYVFAWKDGRWVNYNVEAVREGHSPYFVKYGRSRRFHAEFERAQEEAKANKKGIWGGESLHYDDYEERIRWWRSREADILKFEKIAEEDPASNVILTRWNAFAQLEQRLGQPTTVFGSVNDIRYHERGPAVVRLSKSRSSDFDVVFFDRDTLNASGIQFKVGEYVQVRGVVQKYTQKHTGKERLQIQVSRPGQVVAPSEQLDALLSGQSDGADRGDAAPKEEEE